MALVTVSSRWAEIRRDKAYFARHCRELSALLASGPQSANYVVELSQRLRASLDNTIAPVLAAPAVLQAVSAFADADLVGTAWVPGSLPALLGGMTVLAEAIIAECRPCVPKSALNVLLKDTWNTDGSVTTFQVPIEGSAGLRAALDALVNALPE